jgi:lipid-binding SYLF domain-containing protein
VFASKNEATPEEVLSNAKCILVVPDLIKECLCPESP